MRLIGTASRIGAICAPLILEACTTEPPVFRSPDPGLTCSVPIEQIFSGALRDAIPALTDPTLDFQGSPGTELWQSGDRVVSVTLGDQSIAIPLNIFWWHEVVNLEVDGRQIAVTHCPLTGSSLAFDRAAVGGVELGVSGLLFRNNLMMYDRATDEPSFWPQLSRGARCGPRDGTALPMVAAVEMTYDAWRRMNSAGKIMLSDTGWDRDYREYPYGDYDEPNNEQLLFPLPSPPDSRRPPKERALVVPKGDGGLAFPFGFLQGRGPVAAISVSDGAAPYVVFWDTEAQGAMAFDPDLDGTSLTFVALGDEIVDVQTGSRWNLEGRADRGPLTGSALVPIAEAFVAFWFAIPEFQPDIRIWRP